MFLKIWFSLKSLVFGFFLIPLKAHEIAYGFRIQPYRTWGSMTSGVINVSWLENQQKFDDFPPTKTSISSGKFPYPMIFSSQPTQPPFLVDFPKCSDMIFPLKTLHLQRISPENLDVIPGDIARRGSLERMPHAYAKPVWRFASTGGLRSECLSRCSVRFVVGWSQWVFTSIVQGHVCIYIYI